MAALQEKADFRIKGNFIPELRKDMIDTMVQNGTFAGWKQQMKNVKNFVVLLVLRLFQENIIYKDIIVK